MRRALLIDCDGVLVDAEIDSHLAAFNQVWREAGVPWQWTRQQYKDALQISGGRERLDALALSKDFVAAVGSLDRFGDWASTVDRWHRRKTELLVAAIERGGFAARPGIVRLLREARHAGWALAVVSCGSTRTVYSFAHALLGDLAHELVVVTGDDVSKKKPDPEGYRLALHRLGMPSHLALAVEDSAKGLRAALAAGLICLVTTTDATRNQDFSGAAGVFSDLGEPGRPPAILFTDMGPGLSDHITVDHLDRLVEMRLSSDLVRP